MTRYLPFFILIFVFLGCKKNLDVKVSEEITTNSLIVSEEITTNSPIVSEEVITNNPTQISYPVVLDLRGNMYRLYRPETYLSGVLSETELWERINPPDTNHWYTRSLNSRKNTNEVPFFYSLAR